MAGDQVSRSKEALEQKRWEVAWNFVNSCAGNKTAAYLKYYDEHGIEKPAYPAAQAHKFFKTKEIQQLIEQFRKENREAYPHLRDENIAILREVASDYHVRNGDRIAAIKELNNMLGYNSTNLNIQGKVDSEITVEITNL